MLASESEEWVEKIHNLLVTPHLRDMLVAKAKQDFKRELSSEAYARKVNLLLDNGLRLVNMSEVKCRLFMSRY